MIEYENLARLNQPFLDELKARFDVVLNRGLFILGEEVDAFEKEFAAYCGTSFCCGVGNGSEAISLALRSFSFKEGSEVIVPANTYIASILPIVHCGLVPVLVEPDKSTCNLDPDQVERAITSRTAGILAVHLYGKSCSMNDLITLKKKYSLALVEDCAQAHGAKYKGKRVGSFGEAGAFSFYPTKNLGALGDAGSVITNDPAIEKRVRLLRNYGSGKKNYNELIGVNSRLDELQAAFLRVKLKHLDQHNEKRQHFASMYHDGLGSQFQKPPIDPDFVDVYYIYNVRHPDRDRLRSYLNDEGIETMIHYPVPPHRQQAFRGQFKLAFPITEEIHSTTLSLPISPIHTEEEVRQVIDVMNSF